MTNPVTRQVVERFYAALAVRDLETLAPYLDDDVVWTISGPVDILPICGRHSGKANVLRMLDGQVPTLFTDRRFTVSAMLIDGDRAAVLGRLTATLYANGRSISYRTGKFMQFRDGKLIDYTSIIDSFDAAEQVLGHSLGMNGGSARAADGDIVAL